MNKNLIEEIKGLGLNSYEAKVYLALMERDSLSVSDVSKISRVPRARTYDILDTLVTQGLATLKPGQIKKYSAADPDSLRERLLARSETDYVDQKKTIERVTLILKRKFETTLASQARRANPLDYIEIIKEPHQIHKKFNELMDAAERETLVFTKPPYTGSRKALEEQTEKQAEPLRRGVIMRSIYEIPKANGELGWWDNDVGAWYRDVERAAQQGETARVIDKLPMKMVVIDERIVMIPLEDPVATDTSFTAQVVKHSSMAAGLKILFETMWERAIDYREFKKNAK